MNKGELVEAIAAKLNCTQKDAGAVVAAMCEAIIDAVAAGEKVTLVGFGTFEPRARKAREGRNPATGEAIKIPAQTVPSFSAGKLFKEKVNNA